MTRCARCGNLRDCQTRTVYAIALCGECLSLVIREWHIRREEIGELLES